MGITAEQVKEICDIGRSKNLDGRFLLELIKELRTFTKVKERLMSI